MSLKRKKHPIENFATNPREIQDVLNSIDKAKKQKTTRRDAELAFSSVGQMQKHALKQRAAELSTSHLNQATPSGTVQTRRSTDASSKMEFMAAFAKASYEKDNDKRLQVLNRYLPENHGYNVDRDLSNEKLAVFVNPQSKNVITSFRGTDPKNVSDLTADFHLAIGKKSFSTRFLQSRLEMDRILKKYKGFDHSLSSHSLGGALNEHVRSSFGGQLKEVYNFNRGAGLPESQFSTLLGSLPGMSLNFGGQILGRQQKPKKGEKQAKVFDYHIFGDPISALRNRTKGDVVLKKRRKGSAHTIDQFL